MQIYECPAGRLWNDKTGSCVNDSDVCEPKKEWSEQSQIDLVDCIGFDENDCYLGFSNLRQAKVFCENDESCVGVKLSACSNITTNIACFGDFWRPYKRTISKYTNESVYLIISKNQIEINDDNQEGPQNKV